MPQFVYRALREDEDLSFHTWRLRNTMYDLLQAWARLCVGNVMAMPALGRICVRVFVPGIPPPTDARRTWRIFIMCLQDAGCRIMFSIAHKTQMFVQLTSRLA